MKVLFRHGTMHYPVNETNHLPDKFFAGMKEFAKRLNAVNSPDLELEVIYNEFGSIDITGTGPMPEAVKAILTNR